MAAVARGISHGRPKWQYKYTTLMEIQKHHKKAKITHLESTHEGDN